LESEHFQEVDEEAYAREFVEGWQKSRRQMAERIADPSKSGKNLEAITDLFNFFYFDEVRNSVARDYLDVNFQAYKLRQNVYPGIEEHFKTRVAIHPYLLPTERESRDYLSQLSERAGVSR